MRRRVVITGLGVVTSLGENVPEMWENLCAGTSGITMIGRRSCRPFEITSPAS